jgi:hypothetical protein
MTIQVADDDASVAWECSPSFRFCAPSLSKSDVRREQLMDGVGDIVGLPERGDREPRTTNVTDHGQTSTASRSACFWSRLLRSRQRRAGASYNRMLWTALRRKAAYLPG